MTDYYELSQAAVKLQKELGVSGRVVNTLVWHANLRTIEDIKSNIESPEKLFLIKGMGPTTIGALLAAMAKKGHLRWA